MAVSNVYRCTGKCVCGTEKSVYCLPEVPSERAGTKQPCLSSLSDAVQYTRTHKKSNVFLLESTGKGGLHYASAVFSEVPHEKENADERYASEKVYSGVYWAVWCKEKIGPAVNPKSRNRNSALCIACKNAALDLDEWFWASFYRKKYIIKINIKGKQWKPYY